MLKLQTRLIAKHRLTPRFCAVALRITSLCRVNQNRGGVRIIHAHEVTNWFHLVPGSVE
jgi:hypothetical protein